MWSKGPCNWQTLQRVDAAGHPVPHYLQIDEWGLPQHETLRFSVPQSPFLWHPVPFQYPTFRSPLPLQRPTFQCPFPLQRPIFQYPPPCHDVRLPYPVPNRGLQCSIPLHDVRSPFPVPHLLPQHQSCFPRQAVPQRFVYSRPPVFHHDVQVPIPTSTHARALDQCIRSPAPQTLSVPIMNDASLSRIRDDGQGDPKRLRKNNNENDKPKFSIHSNTLVRTSIPYDGLKPFAPSMMRSPIKIYLDVAVQTSPLEVVNTLYVTADNIILTHKPQLTQGLRPDMDLCADDPGSLRGGRLERFDLIDDQFEKTSSQMREGFSDIIHTPIDKIGLIGSSIPLSLAEIVSDSESEIPSDNAISVLYSDDSAEDGWPLVVTPLPIVKKDLRKVNVSSEDMFENVSSNDTQRSFGCGQILVGDGLVDDRFKETPSQIMDNFGNIIRAPIVGICSVGSPFPLDLPAIVSDSDSGSEISSDDAVSILNSDRSTEDERLLVVPQLPTPKEDFCKVDGHSKDMFKSSSDDDTQLFSGCDQSIRRIINLACIDKAIKKNLLHYMKDVLILDNIKINLEQRIAISLGPKFVFPHNPKELDDRIGLYISTTQIADFHHFNNSFSEEEYRNSIEDEFLKYAINPLKEEGWFETLDPEQAFLRKAYISTLKLIKDNKSIFITQSDKGKQPIVCLKSTYDRKMYELISKGVMDGTYLQIIPSRQLNPQRLKAKIAQIGTLAKKAYNSLRSEVNFYMNGGKREATEKDIIMHNRVRVGEKHTLYVPPLIYAPGHSKYGLVVLENGFLKIDWYCMARMRITIKTHKDDTYPVRPIIAAINPIGKELEIYIHHLLKLFITPICTHTNTSVDPVICEDPTDTKLYMNSKSFIAKNYNCVLKQVENCKIPLNHQLYTLDHVNMYTNVSLKQTLDIIRLKFDETIGDRTHLPLELFLECIEFLMFHNGYFLAQGNIYRQNKGLTMGGGLSYVLSEITTSHGLILAIEAAVDKGLQVSILHKYVDDILIVMNGKDISHQSISWIETLKVMISDNLNQMGTTSVSEKFTTDLPVNLPYVTYLNLRIVRERDPTCDEQQLLHTIWFRPDYKSGRIIHNLSNQTDLIKNNTIFEFIYCAIITTSSCYLPIIATKLYNLVRDNGYSNQFFLEQLKKACKKAGKSIFQITKMLKFKKALLQAPLAKSVVMKRKRFYCNKCKRSIRLKIEVTHNCTRYCSRFIPMPSKKRMLFPKKGDHFRIKAPRYNHITHIQSPFILGISDNIKSLNYSYNIKTVLAKPAYTSRIFGAGKDPMFFEEKILVSFAIWCKDCKMNIIETVNQGNIGENSLNITKKHSRLYGCSIDQLDWNSVKIIKTYKTAYKAKIGHIILLKIMKNNAHFNNIFVNTKEQRQLQMLMD